VREDGTVEPSFGQAGVQELPSRLGIPTAVAVTADARVLLTLAPEDSRARSGTVVRLLPDGRRDPTFGHGRAIAIAARRPTAMVVGPSGHVLVAGLERRHMFIMRLSSDGGLDRGFGHGGRARVSCGHHGEWITTRLLRQPGGRLVAVGTTTVRLRSYGSDVPGEDDDDFCPVGLDADGRIDPSFGHHGRMLVEIGRRPPSGTLVDQDIVRSAVLDAQGRITIAGTVDGDQRHAFGIVRLTPRGRLDRSFSRDGRVTLRFTHREEGVENPSLAIDRGGHVWAAVVTYRGDRFTTQLFALSPEGRRLASFGTHGRTELKARRAWALTLDHDRPVLSANVDWAGLDPPPSGYGVLVRLRRLPR
jgi:uncharacterized delta-60 repeat protein